MLMAHAAVSHAELGEAPVKLEPDMLAAGTPAKVYKGSHAEIETMLASGTRLREYVGHDKKVFAVSWSGPFMPDLQSILGKHFDTLVAESAKRPKAGRSRLLVNTPEVVILSGGHMGAFEGRAWIPAQLPAGFSSDDIK